jgi:hypothetical protein
MVTNLLRYGWGDRLSRVESLQRKGLSYADEWLQFNAHTI